jgi:peroxiredoxin
MFADRLRTEAPAYAEHYDLTVARLTAAKAGDAAPRTGDRMPDFALPGLDGHIETLRQYVARGPVVITFKRGHWCEFCRIELDGLIRAYPEIRKLGAEVVAIMPDSASALIGLQRLSGIPFPLLIDVGNAYALQLGVAVGVDSRLREMLGRDGIDLVQLHGGGTGALLPLPATFVVEPDRTIVARFVDADFRRRMETAEIIAALKPGSAGAVDP